MPSISGEPATLNSVFQRLRTWFEVAGHGVRFGHSELCPYKTYGGFNVWEQEAFDLCVLLQRLEIDPSGLRNYQSALTDYSFLSGDAKGDQQQLGELESICIRNCLRPLQERVLVENGSKKDPSRDLLLVYRGDVPSGPSRHARRGRTRSRPGWPRGGR